MESLLSSYSNELNQDRILVIMPISHLVLATSFKIGSFGFYPAGSCDLNELRLVPNTPIGNGCYKGQQLRELATSATGISLESFHKASLVVFSSPLNWDDFLRGDHHSDLCLLRSLSGLAERVIDLIKFNLCRFDLFETMPSYIGSWDETNGFCAALLYTFHDHESYLIAGAAFSAFVGNAGLGLEIDNSQAAYLSQIAPPSSLDGEVGGVVQHALSLFSDVIAAHTPTIKFIRAMTLFEFLSNPDKFERFQDAKKNIICHVAHSKTEYHQLLDRFREFSEKYRTPIVHNGKYLEEIIGDEQTIKALFRELQHYCGIVIEEMLAHRTDTWDQFREYRKQLKIDLGVVNCNIIE